MNSIVEVLLENVDVQTLRVPIGTFLDVVVDKIPKLVFLRKSKEWETWTIHLETSDFLVDGDLEYLGYLSVGDVVQYVFKEKKDA